jgi:hypothetical protein
MYMINGLFRFKIFVSDSSAIYMIVIHGGSPSLSITTTIIHLNSDEMSTIYNVMGF